MVIKCHQMLKGHSRAQAYNAPMLESRDASKPGMPRSFSFPFSDERRGLPDNDTDNYVLEIEPVNSNYDCTAAICTQYTDVGMPTIYTSWLVPEDGNALTTLQILSRNSFMRGEEVADHYDNGIPLAMRTVEIPESIDHSSWQMTDASQRLLGQFLTMYWMSLVRNQPALGKVDNRIFLLLRDPNNTLPMTNEDAVRFFRDEIASRLPLEAQNMISAVFGVKKTEAEKNFRKAVCVVLSSEIGVPSDLKIDLFRGNQDLFRKIPSHEDREAMRAISECLLAGEHNYPQWYLRLRKLKNGIPQTAAPYLMYFCYILQGLDTGTIKISNPLLYYEQAYMNIMTQLTEAGTSEEEVLTVLYPLLKQISELWCSQHRTDTIFYHSKIEWLMNEAKINQAEALQMISPLTEKIFAEIKKDNKLASAEKIRLTIELLSPYMQETSETYEVTNQLESFLSANFEEWILMPPEESFINQFSEAYFSRILENWNSAGLRHQPEEVKERLLEIFDQYPGIPERKTKNAMTEVDKLCLKEIIRTYTEIEQNGEQLTTEMLKKIARQIIIVGADDSVADICKPAFDIIRRNYHCWLLDEPVLYQQDRRFLDLTIKWINEDTKSIEDYSCDQIETLENNTIKTLSAYDASRDEQEQLLIGIRQKRGIKKLFEVTEDKTIDESVKALRIAGIHRTFRRMPGVLQDNDDLTRQLNYEMKERFLAWNNAAKPFASSEELHYDDNWFVIVAETWLKERLKDYIQDFNAKSLQTLEDNLKAAFEAYRITEDQKKRALSQIRIAKFDAQLFETINDNNINPTDKALKIAGIHKTLGRNDGIINDAPDLVDKLQEEMLLLFLDWQKAEKPFASDEDLYYDDDWFVSVANHWIQHELINERFDSAQLEQLEKDLIEVFGSYRRTKEQQNTDLAPLRVAICQAKLDEIRQMNTDTDDPKMPLLVADLHSVLIRQANICCIDVSDSKKEILSILRETFIAWSNAEKPFSVGMEMRYEDASLFEGIAREWLTFDIHSISMDSIQMEQLIEKLSAAFNSYRIDHEKQKEMLLDLQQAWGIAKIHDIQVDDSLSRTKQALSIAETHVKLRRITNALETNEKLSSYLDNAMLELFLDWEKTEKPFMSGINKRYEDDWFVKIAESWLETSTTDRMEAHEISLLEKDLRTAFNAYQQPIKKQDEILRNLRLDCCRAKLFSVQRDLTKDNPEQALTIASIHNAYRHIATDEATRDLAFEQEISNLQRDCFVAWSKASTPFASGLENRFEDDYFISVTKEWLKNDLPDTDLSDSELDELGTKLDSCLKVYRVSPMDRSAILCPLQIKKSELELNSILFESTLAGPEKASRIAEIHNRLRSVPDSLQEVTELEKKLKEAMLEYFVDWASADKPFATGSGLYSNGDWFYSLLFEWTNDYMDSVNFDSIQFNEFADKINEAIKKYRLRDQNGLQMEIRKKNAELCINEENGQISSSDAVICRIAEMLLSGDVDQANLDLYRKGMTILADNYEKWVMMDPPFKLLNKSISSYQPVVKEMLLNVLEDWKKRKLISSNIDMQSAIEIKNRITNVYEYCRVSKEYEKYVQSLDIIIYRNTFEAINADSITGDTVMRFAGIRKQMLDMDNRQETEELCADIAAFLKDHMFKWTEAIPPLSAEGYGYKDRTVPGIVDEWLQDDFIIQSWSVNELQRIRSTFTEASKQYLSVTGIGISSDAMRKIDLVECDTLIRNVSSGPVVSPDQKDDQEIMLIRALILYASLIDNSSIDDRVVRDLMPMLSQHFVTIVQSQHLTTIPRAFIRLTDEWVGNNLSRYPFDTLDDIRGLQNIVLKKYSAAGASKEQYDEIDCAFEMTWLRIAIDNKTKQHLSPSVLASEAMRIKALNGTPDNRLTDCLLESFADWSEENFRSDYNSKTYAYDSFPSLARQWCKQTELTVFSFEQLERISEKTERVLSQGYALDDVTIEQIVSPINTARMEALFRQVSQKPSEEDLRLIRELYEDEPEKYYNQVLPIFVLLAHKNYTMQQITEFIAIQSDIWERHRNDDIGKRTVCFLNQLWQEYGSQRPEALQNAMLSILQTLKYQLPDGSEYSDNWTRLRDWKLGQIIAKFFRNHDDPPRFADEWDRDNAQDSGLDWSEITGFETFRKALSDWCINQWKNLDTIETRLNFIIVLTETAKQAKESDYKKQLFKLLIDFINESYEIIARNETAQEKLDSIIDMIASNGIDISPVQENVVYQAELYRKNYEQLKKQWDHSLAESMLKKRMILPAHISSKMQSPGKYQESEAWLVLMILSTASSEMGYEYWERILIATGIPELKQLNIEDIREIAKIPFIENVQRCYRIVSEFGAKWAVDDLRKCIYGEAPKLMRTINQVFPVNGIKILVRNGWRGLPEDFADWFRN